MPVEQQFAFQLEHFLEAVIDRHHLILAAHHEYDVEDDRDTYILGSPFGTHLKFYDYTGGVPARDRVPSSKSQHFQWTLKRGRDRPVETPPNSTPEDLKDTLTRSLETIFDPRYYNRYIRDKLMTVNNGLVLRTSTQQLRFTFLEGDTMHGHAHIEALTAPVRIV